MSKIIVKKMKNTEEILRFVALQEKFFFIWATMNQMRTDYFFYKLSYENNFQISLQQYMHETKRFTFFFKIIPDISHKNNPALKRTGLYQIHTCFIFLWRLSQKET